MKIYGYSVGFANAPAAQSTAQSQFGAKTGTQITEPSIAATATLEESEAVTIPLTVPEGESEVEFTFAASAKGEMKLIEVSADSHLHPTVGSAVAIYAAPTDKGVGISSDIDTSWKKWTGAVSALPNAYKKRNATGALLNEPNDKAVQVGGANTPEDTSDDIWKIVCLRDADGSLSVHSAAFWEEAGDAGWRGAATYRSNTVGFNNPTYLWRLTGGTPGVGTLFDVPNGPSSIFDAIELGSSPEGPTPQSSTISLNVTDANGTLSDEYTVNWHLPAENLVQYGTPRNSYTTDRAVVVSGYSASTNVPDETIQVVVDPSLWNILWRGNDTQRAVTGTVAFVGGVAVAYYSAGTIPTLH